VAENLYDYLNRFNLQDVARQGLSGLQSAANFLNRAGIGVTRKAQADQMYLPGVRNFPADYKKKELEQGQIAENFRRGAGFTGQTPIILGTRDGVTPDRTRSDDYRQYAGTPEEQFKGIFQDYALGGYGDLSKAKGAPKDAQGMLELARKTTAPLGTSLNAYYASQHAAGKIRQDQLVEYFGQRSQEFGEWAKANPALAYRQFIKEAGGGPIALAGYKDRGVRPSREPLDAGTVAALENIAKAPDKGSIGERVDNYLKYTAKVKDPLDPDKTGYFETMGDQPTIGDFPIK